MHAKTQGDALGLVGELFVEPLEVTQRNARNEFDLKF